ncbi:hypothetical protein GCM10023094_20250 [Rhodococcus olei]|uniref:OmpR/PhoB-type domain-containing protein n=1 Tax=Rhodococcus olei TaxID=2161675 RepID=A0ABP8NY26_9NOCA
MPGPSTASPPPTSVYLQVLGPVRVLVGDEDVSVGGPVPRALLARLAIAAGEGVSDDALIDHLWGAAPPRTAKLTLQGYVARIRKILDPHRPGSLSRVLTRRGNGYALEPDATDWQQFTALSAEGRHLLAAGDASGAADVLDTALDHWRGDAYADVADSDAIAVEARRLDTLRLDAVEDRMEAALALGDHGAAAAHLDVFTRKHPLRERAWELLARAHYRAGRPGDALDALRRARETLAEELGTDPRPSLLSLQASILAHDDVLTPPIPSAAPIAATAPAAPDPFAHNIPLALTPLVGRRGQLAEVGELLRTHRMVTLTGAGGMGKTRLALEVARIRSDTDGPWLVELAGALDSSQVADALATALGLTVSGGVDALADVLRGRELLLVLDNCEQVVDPAAAVATAILTRCPAVRILATSREPLFTTGEFVYEVPPMTDGEDVQLFVARAAAQIGTFAPDAEERDLLTRLCAELDGMPLAIELAAAQCRTLSVRQLISHVDDRFALLRGGPRTNARHTTMLAAVEWSYQTLTESQRRLFQSLAVFEGGFDLDAARLVVGDAALLGDLGALVDKSLVSVTGGDPRRYRMLETMRGYAARVRDPEQTALLRRNHTRWICDLADAAFVGLRGPDSSRWMRRLDLDFPNVRAALDATVDDPDTYLRIAGGICWYWYRGGHVAEAITRLSPALASAGGQIDPVSSPVRVRAVAGAAVIHYLAGDLPGLFTALGLLTDLAATVADPVSRADAESTLAFFEAGSGLIEQARAHAQASLEFGLRAERPFTAAEALMCLGTADFRAGEYDAAAEHLDEAVRVASGHGYGWCEASSLWIGAKADLAQGRWGGPAEAKLARMIRVCESNADLTSWLVGLATLAYAAFRRGDHETAATLTAVVDRQGTSIGYRPAAMDPVDLAAYDAELRAGLSPTELEDGRVRGAALDRDEVSELVSSAVA